jgi:hypothetical protein
MKTTIILIGLITLALFMPEFINAQPPGLPGAPEQAPIDGGLGILAVAGGAYALKKLRQRKY